MAELAIKYRLPTMFHVEAGGLMSYAPDYSDLVRRAAVYVDKILTQFERGHLDMRLTEAAKGGRKSFDSPV